MQRIQIVRKSGANFETIQGNPTVSSIDGSKRAPLLTLLSANWTDAARAEFGIYKVDVMPPDGHSWTGTFDQGANGEPVPAFTPKAVTAGDVVRERERRLAKGFDYDFEDARGVHRFGTTERDMVGWDEVTKWANAQISLGNQAATMNIVTDTGTAQVSALEWQDILVKAAEFRHPIWMGSFALQAMDPVPENYTDDTWWQPQE